MDSSVLGSVLGSDSRGRRKCTEATNSETKQVATVTDEQELLIPGIPNEITINQICTKLPWRAVYVLSSVSPGWHRAARSRQVYDARVRSQSTETLAVLGRQVSDKLFAFDLYSLQDRACYQLPWLSQLEGRRPTSRCVSLDGKIYAMGRLRDANRKVCVLDVAGHRGWKNCADMESGRVDFGCGVLDGKIYVIGGLHTDLKTPDYRDHQCGSEVYDPVTNVWVPIAPMRSRRTDHYVSSVGEELCVYGGYPHDAGYGPYISDTLEIYHPAKNEWRRVGWSTSKSKRLFMSQGKLYGVRKDGIYVHHDDIERDAWEIVHLFKDEFRHPDKYEFVAVGDEVICLSRFGMNPEHAQDLRLCQSKGFGKTKEPLVWETVKLLVSKYPKTPRLFMCTVEL